jgi:uncharacterized protein (UPF0147 family)
MSSEKDGFINIQREEPVAVDRIQWNPYRDAQRDSNGRIMFPQNSTVMREAFLSLEQREGFVSFIKNVKRLDQVNWTLENGIDDEMIYNAIRRVAQRIFTQIFTSKEKGIIRSDRYYDLHESLEAVLNKYGGYAYNTIKDYIGKRYVPSYRSERSWINVISINLQTTFEDTVRAAMENTDPIEALALLYLSLYFYPDNVKRVKHRYSAFDDPNIITLLPARVQNWLQHTMYDNPDLSEEILELEQRLVDLVDYAQQRVDEYSKIEIKLAHEMGKEKSVLDGVTPVVKYLVLWMEVRNSIKKTGH